MKITKKTCTMLLIIVLICVLTASTATVFSENSGTETDSYSEKSSDKDISYTTETINENSKYLINKADGYRIMLPASAKIDGRFSEFRIAAETPGLRLEIYRQKLASTYSSYVSYGNRFISDEKTYKKIFAGNMTFAGKSAYVLEWSRSPLSRIENDRCYYACVDLKISDNEVMTFFFKSTLPFDANSDIKSYVKIMNTLKLTEKTAVAHNTRTRAVASEEWNEETLEFFDKYFGDSAELTWGIFQKDAPYWTMENLNRIEKIISSKFRFLLCYTDFKTRNEYLRSILKKAADDDRTIELTLQTTSVDEGNMVLDVLDGKYDDYLNEYAEAVADSKKPVLFRICNEMNGDWCLYSAYHTSKDTEIYVNLYKYIYSIFKKNGALENTIWVWNPNYRSLPDYCWNHALCYYPGDEYVNVIGLTAYNTGAYYRATGEKWRSFESCYTECYYAYDAWFSQPMMITEFACSSFGGDKVAWTKDMFAAIKSYKRIKAAIWWNGADFDSDGNMARPYYIDDPVEVLEVFKENISK